MALKLWVYVKAIMLKPWYPLQAGLVCTHVCKGSVDHRVQKKVPLPRLVRDREGEIFQLVVYRTVGGRVVSGYAESQHCTGGWGGGGILYVA